MDDDDDSYDYHMRRTFDGFFPLACCCIVMGLSKKTFLEAATMAFDYAEKWHKHNLTEDDE